MYPIEPCANIATSKKQGNTDQAISSGVLCDV